MTLDENHIAIAKDGTRISSRNAGRATRSCSSPVLASRPGALPGR